MQLRRFAYLMCGVALAACGSDSPSGVNAGVSGSVGFTYTGAGGGTYNASGAITATATSSTAHNSTWAAGWKDNSDGSTNIASNTPTSGGLANYIAVIVNGQTTGTFTINASCSPTATTTCTDVVFLVGYNEAGNSWNFVCALESGSVTIASISSTKATGSFSGTGTCINSTGSATTAFAISGGSFDVPLFSGVPGNL